jgi:hypothetical protein
MKGEFMTVQVDPVNKSDSFKTPKIVLIEWASILGVFIVCFLFLFSEIKHLETKIDQQSARTDRLYEMFIDLRNENDQKFSDMNQKFYELRKESDQKFYDLLKEKK